MTASTPTRPAAYARVESGLDVSSWRGTLTVAARCLGRPPPTFYGDTGRSSGWNHPGSGLAALTEEIQAGRCDAVIIPDQAVISRYADEVEPFCELCARHGVIIHNLDSPDQDMTTPQGRFVTGLRTALATWDHDRKAAEKARRESRTPRP